MLFGIATTIARRNRRIFNPQPVAPPAPVSPNLLFDPEFEFEGIDYRMWLRRSAVFQSGQVQITGRGSLANWNGVSLFQRNVFGQLQVLPEI